MNRYSAFLILIGLFSFTVPFFLPNSPSAPFPIFPRLCLWILGPVCFGWALIVEIWEVESASENFQWKKREPVQIVVKGYVSGGWTENDLNNLIASNTVKADYTCVLKSPVEVEIAEVLSLAIRHEKCDFITVTRLVEGKLRGVLHD